MGVADELTRCKSRGGGFSGEGRGLPTTANKNKRKKTKVARGRSLLGPNPRRLFPSFIRTRIDDESFSSSNTSGNRKTERKEQRKNEEERAEEGVKNSIRRTRRKKNRKEWKHGAWGREGCEGSFTSLVSSCPSPYVHAYCSVFVLYIDKPGWQ